MDFSNDQLKALSILLDWINSEKRKQFITLGGYAGTGKTTLIAALRKKIREKDKKISVSFVSYTGKATRVLKSKLEEHKTIFDKDTISTIHSLIYSPKTNERKEIVGWELKDNIKTDLIIVDEASMVDESIWKDLSSFRLPIIAVGDHGQLPPIKGNFSLMQNPDIKLEQIHRQAKGNPIIQISIQARSDGFIQTKKYSDTVRKFSKESSETREIIETLLQHYDEDTLILCGYNFTRVKLNNYLRQIKEIETKEPVSGDRVICLRNNHEKQIFNGMTGTISNIEDADENWYFAEIDMDGEDKNYSGLIYAPQFGNVESINFSKERNLVQKGDLFDFGYALTVHKAQGSQSHRVILFEERFKQMDDDMWRRWLYTAVTRAEEELYIIGN